MLVRLSPYRSMHGLNERLRRVLTELLPSLWENVPDFDSSWIPTVDVYEKNSELVLKAELPDIEHKDLDIRIEDDLLILSGERKCEKESEEKKYYRRERVCGAFSRSFRLPRTVDRQKIKASFKVGVLKISMPKKEKNKPKKIEILVN